MQELAANEIIALHYALNHLWSSTGGKGQPYPDWLQSVLHTLYGEDYAETVPVGHLPAEAQAWHQEAVKEGLAALPPVCDGQPLLNLDPADEATLAIIQAQDDFRWTAPLIWLLAEHHTSGVYRMVLRRSLDQLTRILVALAELDALEEAS